MFCNMQQLTLGQIAHEVPFFSFFGNNALATNVKGQYLGEEGWHRPGRRGQWVVEDDHCVLPFPV